ncbi:MAG: phosphatidylinositol kinase [Phycisphaerales bacterium]|jgi:serine/threonine-protein kinase HipA|nr:phosphatidylinositol kinase [Phycisphaerales bacterium]
MTRCANVFYRNRLAGRLTELTGEYRFVYDESYLADGRAISLTLPLQAEPFESETLFSFFAGLAPEGWYLRIVSPTIKVDERDTFGLLIKTCGDCIGAVSLQEVEDGND